VQLESDGADLLFVFKLEMNMTVGFVVPFPCEEIPVSFARNAHSLQGEFSFPPGGNFNVLFFSW